MITATRNNPTADGIAMVIVLLMAIGTVFVFSASANVGQISCPIKLIYSDIHPVNHVNNQVLIPDLMAPGMACSPASRSWSDRH